MLLLDAPQNVRGEVHLAVRAERRNRPTGRRVERDQPPATRDEDPPLLPVAPRGDAAVYEPGAVRRLSRLVRLRVVGPVFPPGRGVERDDAIERRAEVQRVADGEWRHLKLPGPRGERRAAGRNRLLARLPR